jgi:hypothetical protein
VTLPVDVEVRVVCRRCGWERVMWLPLGRGPVLVECEQCERPLDLDADIRAWRSRKAAQRGIPTIRATPR